MPRELERRLRRLEQADSAPGQLAIWCEQRDGTIRGPGGERMTRKTFFRRYPPGTPGVMFCNRTDALL
jgi:hypothetical protein